MSGDFLEDEEGGVVEEGMALFSDGDATSLGGRSGTLGYTPFPSESFLPANGLGVTSDVEEELLKGVGS